MTGITPSRSTAMSSRLNDAASRAIEALIATAKARDRPIGLDTTALIAYIAWEVPVARLIEFLLTDPHLHVVLSTLTLAEAVTRPAMMHDLARVREIPRLRVA